MTTPFDLSYQINTVQWDGHVISDIETAQIVEQLEVLAELDVRGVMISGYHLEEDSSFDVDSETRRIGELVQSHGFKVAQHHGLSATYAPLGTSQQEAVDHLKRSIDFTANLGAESLVLHSGRITGRFQTTQKYYDLFFQQCQEQGEDAVIAQCAENLHLAGEHAEKCGVTIAMENLDRFEPLGNQKQLKALIDQADHPAVGFCLDSGHAWAADVDPCSWIRLMGQKLFTTHFHDNHGSQGRKMDSAGFISPHGIDEHFPPGFGTIDWRAVIRALKETNYAHMVNFESSSWPDLPAEEGYRSAIAYWRQAEALAER